MSGTSNRIVYSWDTTVVIAWLKAEQDKPLADIYAVAEQIEKGEADLAISVIVIAEVLDVITDKSLAADLNAFLHRPNVQIFNVDPRVARRTAQLRTEWRDSATHENQPRNIKTPDAIIIATAMLAEATVLHSTEPRFHRHHKTALVEGLEIKSPVLWNNQRVLQLPTAIQAEAASDQQKIELPLKGSIAAGAPAASDSVDAGAGDIRSTDDSAAEEAPLIVKSGQRRVTIRPKRAPAKEADAEEA